MGPLHGSRVKIRGHMIAHRTPSAPGQNLSIQSNAIKEFSYHIQPFFEHNNTTTTTTTHLSFNGPFSGTTQVSRYQKGKTNLNFTEARDSEWQWHQLGHMQVCTSLHIDNHASTPPLRCPSCRPTNSVKALKAHSLNTSM